MTRTEVRSQIATLFVVWNVASNGKLICAERTVGSAARGTSASQLRNLQVGFQLLRHLVIVPRDMAHRIDLDQTPLACVIFNSPAQQGARISRTDGCGATLTSPAKE